MTCPKDSPKIPSPPTADGAAPTDDVADPAGLTVDQLARLLGMDIEKVHGHLAAGAPTGPGGRVNLVHYAAWLNKELNRTDGD